MPAELEFVAVDGMSTCHLHGAECNPHGPSHGFLAVSSFLSVGSTGESL